MRPRWVRRHRALSATLLFAILAMIWLGVAGAIGLQARTRLAAAQQHLEAAQSALSQAEMDEGQQRLRAAHEAFSSSQQRLDSVVLAPFGRLPVFAENLHAVRETVRAADTLTRSLSDWVAEMERAGGAAALAPRDGRLPLQAWSALLPRAEASAEVAAAAMARVERAADAPLLPPVEEALADVLRQGRSVERATATTAAALRALPALFGADGPRRYFFGAGNPAELRGKGGFLGAYAILTAQDGRLSFGAFDSITRLGDRESGGVAAPNPDYEARYDRYGGAGFWQNINMTPDFPSAAQAIERLYEVVTGTALDGVIVADPVALQAMAEVTGPVDIPSVGRVQPGEVTRVLANEAFGKFDDSATRKRLLGAAAVQIVTRFLQGEGDPIAAGQALADAAGRGNLLLHARDAAVQEALVAAGLAGELYQGGDDYLAVVGVNGAGNKADFYMDRTVRYDAVLENDGSVVGRASVDLNNHTPTQGLPSYIIGPNYFDFGAGENATILNVFCGRCAISRFARDGQVTPARFERELGSAVFWTYERLPSGKSVNVAYDWRVPDAWHAARYRGTYRLVVDGQVTLRPTKFQLHVTLPAGVTLVGMSHDMRQDGAVVSWEGDLVGRQVFELTIRPEGNAAWHALTRWWNRPLREG